MNESLRMLMTYVDAANTMAESMARDLARDKQYSNETVTAVARFVRAARQMQKELDMINRNNVRLN